MKVALLFVIASLLSATLDMGYSKDVFWEKVYCDLFETCRLVFKRLILKLSYFYCERSCCDFLFHYPAFIALIEISFDSVGHLNILSAVWKAVMHGRLALLLCCFSLTLEGCNRSTFDCI